MSVLKVRLVSFMGAFINDVMKIGEGVSLFVTPFYIFEHEAIICGTALALLLYWKMFYSQDLNSRLVQYSNLGYVSVLQMVI